MTITEESVSEEIIAWKVQRGAAELFVRAANRNGAHVNAWRYWIEVEGEIYQVRISRDKPVRVETERLSEA